MDKEIPVYPAGVEIVAGQCLVAGDEHNIRQVNIVSVRTLSSGLTPESVETQIISYDPADVANSVVRAVWPADLAVSDYENLMPTRYGFMAYGSGGILGFDLNTLQVAWRSDATPSDSEVNYEGYVVETRDPGMEAGIDNRHFHSARDNAELASVIGPSGVEAHPHGFFVRRGTDAQWERVFVDMQTSAVKGPLPSGGQFWGNKYLAYDVWDENYIKVWDVTTMQIIFSREGSDVEGLNIEDVYLAGDYLYIKNDADSPVIDLTSTKKVSSGWKLRPVDIINGDWYLVIDGTVSNGYSSCFEMLNHVCYEEGRLVHAPDGRYEGPWF